MPDFIVTLSQHGHEKGKVWTQSVTVQDVNNAQVASAIGIDELMKWVAEEIKSDPASIPVKPEAIAYWEECRRSGSLQMYEIYSEMQGRFQIDFTAVAKQDAPPQKVDSPPANGRKSTKVVGQSARGELPDLRTMMTERLAMLQGQEKTLNEDYDRITEERAAIREDIRQTTEVLIMLGQPKAKKGKAAKVEAAE